VEKIASWCGLVFALLICSNPSSLDILSKIALRFDFFDSVPASLTQFDGNESRLVSEVFPCQIMSYHFYLLEQGAFQVG
jgi:hypothetical protein